MNDLLWAEEAILNRLRDQVTQMRTVAGARELKAIPTHARTTPALYLIADGYQPWQHAGAEQAIEQLWLVVVAIRNLRLAEGGAGERREAGPVLWQSCQALIGWQPDPTMGAMRLVASPGTICNEDLVLFPLRFATRIVLNGAIRVEESP